MRGGCSYILQACKRSHKALIVNIRASRLHGTSIYLSLHTDIREGHVCLGKGGG